ncbi:hypothetical protein FRC03_007180 [Tulasnella sp. 419]|nr:hypothetical protein FRC03_007180 [Tulasnella sp. 419]
MNRWATTETTKLALTALGASIVTYSVIEVYRTFDQRRRRKALGRDVARHVYADVGSKGLEERDISPGLDDESPLVQPLDQQANPAAVNASTYDESLIREQLSRNYSFFGDEGMSKLRGGRVAIVGCGGVGSWAATMLVRSGVSYVRLIDFDNVTLSSLNRHAVATLADVGTPKVTACKKYFHQIAPWVEVDARIELWKSGREGERLLGGNIDWVIDAIDNITTKVELLKYCHERNIKVFASMGAGTKCDPTRIQISDISDTQEDPLARSVRRRLKMSGITSGIPVVYSTEIPSDVKLLPLPEEEFKKGAVHELGPFDDFRVRILPVLGPLPSIFGLHAATYILCDLAQKPILNPLPVRNRKKLYEKLLRDLSSREAKESSESGLMEKLPIDEYDISFIFEDLNRGRSSIPPHPILPKAHLARWDKSKPLAVDNCVVLSAADVKLLDQHSGKGADVPTWTGGTTGMEASPVVERRLNEARQWAKALS